jgi:protein-tyrosine kinase
MSRIHEALKKAERERAALQGDRPQPDEAAVVPSEPLAMPVQEVRRPEVAPGDPWNGETVMPVSAGPFNLDALMARCIPRPWEPDDRTMLFFNGADSARGVEEFRTLRSRLYSVREKTPLKKILITSALPQEGKSFTAANLAQVLARQHGRRVLLVDADLRGPRLHVMLGTTSSPGLADYLQDGGDEFAIMQRGPMENLFFIPSGHEISDPAELVANGRFPKLLNRVEPLFDWIIVDSPPAVPVSDSSVLAKACDGVLLVVRSNATPMDMARRARQEFSEETLIGVVLNGAHAELPYPRYYYDEVQKTTIESKS